MKCFPKPKHLMVNPYPDGRVGVVMAHLESDLVLLRTAEDLQNRDHGSDVYVLGADFTARWEADDGKGGTVTAPAGFITDLTSVRWMFRWFVSRAGPWLEAAVVHDYLYIAWQVLGDRGNRSHDRKFADDLMFASMTAAKVGHIRKWVIYLAVRAGGWYTYKNQSQCDAYFGNEDDPRLVYLSQIPTDTKSFVV